MAVYAFAFVRILLLCAGLIVDFDWLIAIAFQENKLILLTAGSMLLMIPIHVHAHVYLLFRSVTVLQFYALTSLQYIPG